MRRWLTTTLAGVGIVALIVASLITFFTPAYMVNDDIAMAMFASGGYTGSPTPHLVFMGIAPGLVLWALYSVNATIPWYPIMLLALLSLSLGFVLAAAWAFRHRIGVARMALVMLACATALPTMALDLTFTCVAIVVGVAGVLALCIASRLNAWPATLSCGAAVLGVVVCGSIRSFAVLGVLIVFAPTIVAALVRLPQRQAAAVVLATLAGLGLIRMADGLAESDTAWTSYRDFNEVRGALHGTRSFELFMDDQGDATTTEQLDRIGWSWADLDLFNEFFFDDPVVYSTTRLEAVHDLVGDGDYSLTVHAALNDIVSGRGQGVIVTLLALLASFLACRWRGRTFIGAQTAWAIGVFVATAMTQRFPDRIGVPLVLGLAVLAVLAPPLFFDEPRTAAHRHASTYQVAIATLCAWASFTNLTVSNARYSASTVSHANDVMQARYERDMFVLNAVDPDGRFLYAGAWVAIEGTDPFAAQGPYEPHRLLGLGWPTFSPLYEARRDRLGIPGDLLQALVQQPGLYLVFGFPPEWVEQAFARRLGLNVDLVELARLDDGAVVYRARQVS